MVISKAEAGAAAVTSNKLDQRIAERIWAGFIVFN
jgi:hypothetical protein